MEWYKAGIETSQCHKVPLQDGREILVRMGQYGRQGVVLTDLYLEDLLNATGTLMVEETSPFFTVLDNAGTCDRGHELTRAFIEKVEFAGSVISVAASFGQSKPGDAQPCSPPVKSYHLDFVFDGHDYKPTAASAETVRLFGSQ